MFKFYFFTSTSLHVLCNVNYWHSITKPNQRALKRKKTTLSPLK